MDRILKIIYFFGGFAVIGGFAVAILLFWGFWTMFSDDYSDLPTYSGEFSASMFSQEDYVGCIQNAFSDAEIPIELYADNYAVKKLKYIHHDFLAHVIIWNEADDKISIAVYGNNDESKRDNMISQETFDSILHRISNC